MASAAFNQMPNPVRQLLEKRRDEVVSRLNELETEEIRELRGELAELEKAIAILSGVPGADVSRGVAGRFTSWKPRDAIRVILEEKGSPMPEEEVVNVALADGLQIGKLRPERNLRHAISVNVKIGELILEKGQLFLPEWKGKTPPSAGWKAKR